nr:uncharacterized protein LOC107452520 [Parasteatoda tepidariorum]
MESIGSKSSVTQIFEHDSGGRFKIRKIEGDGNCLFRSMSYLIFGKQREHEYLRDLVVRYVTEHWEQFSDYNVDEDMDSYKISMCSFGTYGGELEIVAFSKIFQTQPVVYFKSSPEQNPLMFGTHGALCFFLYSGPSDNGHYDVLKPLETIWCDAKTYEQSVKKMRSRCRDSFLEDLKFYKNDLKSLSRVGFKKTSDIMTKQYDRLTKMAALDAFDLTKL